MTDPAFAALVERDFARAARDDARWWLNNRRKESYKNDRGSAISNMVLGIVLAAVSIHAIAAETPMTMVRRVPVVTGLLIVALCIFTVLITKTKLGQDFRSAGFSQHVSQISGINVDQTRIIATMISTVLAAWGQIIYLQNMGMFMDDASRAAERKRAQSVIDADCKP